LQQFVVTAGIDQMHAGVPAEHLAHAVGDKRVGMKQKLHLYRPILCKLPNGLSNAGEPLLPAFPPVARYQNPWLTLPSRPGCKACLCLDHRIDAGVASYVDRAGHVLGAQIVGGDVGRSEEELGLGINRDPIFLLRPGKEGVMRAKAGLHMCHGNTCGEARERPAERARRVALDDQQIGRSANEQRQKRLGDGADMGVGVFASRLAQVDARISIEAEVALVQVRVLTGEDHRRHHAALRKRARNGLHLDGFGSGADDQPDFRGTQPSP